MTSDVAEMAWEDPLDVLSSGAVLDPYPMYAVARQVAPVQRLELDMLKAMAEATDFDIERQLDGRDYAYICFGRDEIVEILRDGVTYSSRNYEVFMGELIGRSLSLTDGAEHDRLRKLVGHPFGPVAVQRWEEEFIQPLVDRLVDAFAGDGRAELNRQLAAEVPVQTIDRIIGVPAHDYPRFRQWAFDCFLVAVDRPRAVKAADGIRSYLVDLLAARRDDPGDDLISGLVTLELDGERLTDQEVLNAVVQLLLAGTETTFRGIGTVMFHLLSHPDQLELVRKDYGLIPSAVEEALRLEPPLPMGARTATRPTRLGPYDLEEGDLVMFALGSANRDERYYLDPDRFDVLRNPEQPSLTFATGPHYCIGARLARAELRVVIQALLERFPDLRFDPGCERPFMRGALLRGPSAMPVAFTPQPANQEGHRGN
jgi:cytochrome P450